VQILEEDSSCCGKKTPIFKSNLDDEL